MRRYSNMNIMVRLFSLPSLFLPSRGRERMTRSQVCVFKVGLYKTRSVVVCRSRMIGDDDTRIVRVLETWQ